MLWSYVTRSEKYKSNRQQKDISRKVRGARLYVPNMPFAAVFYDLPGIGGVDEPYQGLVSKALTSADCIIYVTYARKELTDVEVKLIADIERIVKNSPQRRPVFFVLSGTDMYKEADVQEVLDQDNDILRENFPDPNFVGTGFIGVAPSREARAKALYKKDAIDEEQRDRIIVNSNMNLLRRKILDYLSTQSGPARLRRVVISIKDILDNALQSINMVKQIELKPLQEAEQEYAELKLRISNLANNQPALAEKLDKHSERAIANSAPIGADKFKDMLEIRMAQFIQKEKVTDVQTQIQFNRELDQLWQEWLVENDVEAKFRKSFESYSTQILALVRAQIEDAVDAEEYTTKLELANFVEDVPDADFETSNPDNGTQILNNFDNATKIIGYLGLGGGGALTTLATILATTSAVAWQAGIPLLAGGAIFLGLSFYQGKVKEKNIREKMYEYIALFAERQCNALRKQVRDSIGYYRTEVENVINKYVNDLHHKQRVYLDRRKKTGGDLQMREERLRRLEGFQQRVKVIEDNLVTLQENLP